MTQSVSKKLGKSECKPRANCWSIWKRWVKEVSRNFHRSSRHWRLWSKKRKWGRSATLTCRQPVTTTNCPPWFCGTRLTWSCNWRTFALTSILLVTWRLMKVTRSVTRLLSNSQHFFSVKWSRHNLPLMTQFHKFWTPKSLAVKTSKMLSKPTSRSMVKEHQGVLYSNKSKFKNNAKKWKSSTSIKLKRHCLVNLTTVSLRTSPESDWRKLIGCPTSVSKQNSARSRCNKQRS